LSISRHLVERMGGRLEIESTPEVGSRFSFEISLVPTQAPSEFANADSSTSRAANAADLDLRGRRILVAEDQPINQRIIHDMLCLFGAEVTLAPNGREALQRLAEGDFDLVLMDIQMPEMDGLSATEHLRNNPAWAKLPVVALTAGVTTTERERIRTAGLSDLLAKPLRLSELKSILGRWLPSAPSGAGSEPAPSSISPDPSAATPSFNTEAESAAADVDLQHLFALLGDRAECNELLRDFAQSSSLDMDTITAALGAENRSEARAIAHRLRGAAGNVGANRLSAAADRLEKALDTGQTTYQDILTDLRAAHKAAVAEIARSCGDD
jgi:CheY-like chemotaxis protein